MISSIDAPTEQLFLSLCQVLLSFHLGHVPKKKRSVISKDVHVTLKVSRNVVNKNKKQQGFLKLSLEIHPLALSTIEMLGHLKPPFETFQKENY